MGQNLQYKIGSYGTPNPQDFCKVCSQKHLAEILSVGRNLMETEAFFLTAFYDIDKIYFSI